MLKLDVLNWEKKKVDQISLDEDLFKHEVRWDIISEVVRWQLAGRRQGSHHVKTRGAVRGGGAKPFRQKGTGRARQGSIRSPLLRKGGVAHGPHPRSYASCLPAKIKRLGLKSAVSYLYSKNQLFVVENMKSAEGKTKELNQRLKKMDFKKALLVDEKKDVLFSRACKNLPSYQLTTLLGVNVYDLLKYGHVIFTKKSLDQFQTEFKKKEKK